MTKPNLIRQRSRETARVCVAGCGHWGKNLIRNFHALGNLAAICDANPAAVRKFAVEYPDAQWYTDFGEALQDPNVDAVVLATPAEMHYRMAMEAIAAGKDVFVEKPLALDTEEAREMVHSAREAGLVLMVGHLLRYHPAIEKIQQLITEGVLGRVEYIYSNRLSMGKIRQEENALWSFAPHDISVILALVGQMPMQVTATGGAYLQPNIADVTVSNLLFDNGTRAHIFVSWLHPYKEQRLVVVGSRQMVVFEDTQAEGKLVLFDKRIELKNGAMEAAKPPGRRSRSPATSRCCASARISSNAYGTGSEPLTPGEEGVRVLQVLQACQRSLQMNGEPVQVAERICGGWWRSREQMDKREYFVHESSYVDEPCVVGRRHEDLAFFPRDGELPAGRAVQHRAERGDFAGRRHRATTSKSKTTFPYTRAAFWRTTSSAGLRWCSPTW